MPARWLQSVPPFGIEPVGSAAVSRVERGCSSGVEHNLAKVGVVGSNPIARSRFPSTYRAVGTR